MTATFTSLPTEIHREIVFHLTLHDKTPSAVRQYALVCSLWRDLVQERLFSKVVVAGPDTHRFIQAVGANRHIPHYIRNLKVRDIRYGDNPREEDEAAFAGFLRSLWAFLPSGDSAAAHPSLSLLFFFDTNFDYPRRRPVQYSDSESDSDAEPAFEEVAQPSKPWTGLLSPDLQLPALASVASLTCGLAKFSSNQLLSPRSFAQMLNSLPSLRSLNCRIDNVCPDLAIRQENYEALVETLPQWPRTVKIFRFSFYTEAEREESLGGAGSSEAGSDDNCKLGRALREYSKQMVQVWLDGFNISEELFFDAQDEMPWPDLEIFSVNANKLVYTGYELTRAMLKMPKIRYMLLKDDSRDVAMAFHRGIDCNSELIFQGFDSAPAQDIVRMWKSRWGEEMIVTQHPVVH